MALIRVVKKQSGGGGSTVKRKTEFYPFQTRANISNYGGGVYASIKFSEDDLEDADKIFIDGVAYYQYGSSQSKINRIVYIFVGEKNGKWCYFDGTAWVVTETNISDFYTTSDYNVGGWQVIVNLAGTQSTFASSKVRASIPVGNIIALAKANDINLTFAKSTIKIPSMANASFSDVVGDSCLLIYNGFSRVASTTNASASYGFSVDENRSNSTNPDSTETLGNNVAQVRIQKKIDASVPSGMIYKDGTFYHLMTGNYLVDNITYNEDNIALAYTSKTNYAACRFPVTEDTFDVSDYSNLEIDYYTSADSTKRTLVQTLSGYTFSTPQETQFGVGRLAQDFCGYYLYANSVAKKLDADRLQISDQNVVIYVTRIELVE